MPYATTLQRWTLPDSYFGATWEHYYSAGFGRSRDSSCLEESNFAFVRKALEALSHGGQQRPSHGGLLRPSHGGRLRQSHGGRLRPSHGGREGPDCYRVVGRRSAAPSRRGRLSWGGRDQGEQAVQV